MTSSMKTSKLGVFSFIDTGVPESNSADAGDYTTIIMLHGYVFHGAGFIRMAQYADKHSARLVFVNRRGYPGSDPYTDEERNLLFSEGEAYEVVNSNMKKWMSHRAQEVYEFLSLLIKNERIPPYNLSTKTGGIALGGWSLGCGFVTGFLANIAKFSYAVPGGTDVKKYLRRVILYDPPYHTLGYPPITQGCYDPLLYPEDPNETAEEHNNNFAAWVSGYYNHTVPSSVTSFSASNLNLGGRPFGSDALRKPTLVVMSEEEQAKYIYPPEGSPGGCDIVFLERGIQFGLFNALRRGALYLSNGSPDSAFESVPQAMRDKTNVLSSKSSLNGDSDVKPSNNINGTGPNGYHAIGQANGLPNGNIGSANDEWPHLEILHVWCDQSVWVLPYGMIQLKAELAAAKSKGKLMRDVRFVRLRGVNHLAHFDDPEQALKAFLSTAEFSDE